MNQKPGSPAGFLCLRFLRFGSRRLIRRDLAERFLKPLIVFVTAELASGSDKAIELLLSIFNGRIFDHFATARIGQIDLF
jgi:hypothetical protein